LAIKSGFIEKMPTFLLWVKPKKSGLLVTFKNKSGLKKLEAFSENGLFWVFFGLFWPICSNLKDYSDEKPTCPLFSLINCDKKN
jgi:hypothetical protein